MAHVVAVVADTICYGSRIPKLLSVSAIGIVLFQCVT